jgi:hypothetical protein
MSIDYRDLFPNKPPINWWPLDEASGTTVYDRGSGAASWGRVNGTNVGASVNQTGYYKSSYYFNYSESDRIELGNSALSFEWNTPFSISFWIYTDWTVTHGTVIGKVKNDSTNRGWNLYYNYPSSGAITFGLYSDTSTTNYIELYFADAVRYNSSTNGPAWTFLTVTYDGTGNRTGLNCYRDGVKLTGTVLSGPASFSSTIVSSAYTYISYRENTSRIQGYLQNIMVFDYELTPHEVKWLFIKGLSPTLNKAAKRCVFWNRLGSANQIAYPEYNEYNDTPYISSGSLSYTSVKHYQGSTVINNTSYPVMPFAASSKYSPLINSKGYMPRGTVEVWVKTTYASDNASLPQYGRIFANTSTSWQYFALFYNRIYDGSRAANTWRFAYQYGVGLWNEIASGVFTFSAGQIMHMAVCWDKDGIEGSTNKVRVYIDGTSYMSSSTLPNGMNGPTIEGVSYRLTVGSWTSITDVFPGTFEDIRIHNYAKTNFSDSGNSNYGIQLTNNRPNYNKKLLFWNNNSMTANDVQLGGYSVFSPVRTSNNPASRLTGLIHTNKLVGSQCWSGASDRQDSSCNILMLTYPYDVIDARSFSIECWIKAGYEYNAAPGNVYYRFLANFSSITYSQCYINIMSQLDSGGGINGAVLFSQSGSGGFWSNLNISGNFTSGEEMHILLTFEYVNPNIVIKSYKNGNFVASVNRATYTTNWLMGYVAFDNFIANNNPSWPSHGWRQTSHVTSGWKLYNYPLSADEVTKAYQNSSGIPQVAPLSMISV